MSNNPHALSRRGELLTLWTDTCRSLLEVWAARPSAVFPSFTLAVGTDVECAVAHVFASEEFHARYELTEMLRRIHERHHAANPLESNQATDELAKTF